MKRIIGLLISVLIFGLIVNPALALGEATQGTNAGVKTYEIEIYGVPTRVTIAENSLLKTPEEVKAFIESHVSREDFLNGVVVNVSEVSSGNSPQSEMTKEFTVSSLKEPLSVGTLLSSVLEVFSIGPFILSGPYALLAMAIIAAAITVAYAVYGDEISDEVREKLDSAYQYFYNYIEERKKDEKTIHIYEREFQGGLPKRIYVKEFVHKKDFKVTVGELVDVITKVPSGRLALNATVKNLKEGNWELAALKGIRFIIGATGEAVAYLAIIKPEAYGPSILNITPRSNAKGPDFIYVKSTEIPPKIPSDLTKWEAKGTTVFRVTTLIRDGYNRNLEGQPGIVSVYRMKGSNLYVAFIYG
ncbi:hypothetical protein TEU_10270 [Thermococcus eurythermalis]|uniref:Uncharacterized protein n=1 Tax=Thermococcus eurythermalis TaxID=1505907 RepID=A0A097QW61_9EURY|nr:hypothetical protein TEU_10270 [Thermococcus eurythermalis]